MKEYPFEVSPLATTFGVSVRGVDLRNPSDAQVQALAHLLAYHLLVLAPGQELTAEDQVAFNNRLGAVRFQDHAWSPPADPDAKPGRTTSLGDLPQLNRGDLIYFQNGPGLCDDENDPTVVFDEAADDQGVGTSCWHTGDTEKFNVEVCNCLYAEEAPTAKGQTRFLDTTTAYEDLPAAKRELFAKLRSIHVMKFPEEVVDKIGIRHTEPISQAFVKTNPVTGRRFMVLNFFDFERFEGMGRQESWELAKFLYDHVTQPRYRYYHTWTTGDLVFWNCLGTLHKRGPLATGVRRVLRRTQFEVPAMQSKTEWEKSREVPDYDGGLWHPYPFQEAPTTAV